MSVPNQRIVNTHINKKADPDNKVYIAIIRQDDWWQAYQDLGSAIVLWFYFAENQDNFRMELSSTDYCTKSKDSRSSFTRYFKKLEEKGYLVRKSEDSNVYDFFANPKDKTTAQTFKEDYNIYDKGFKF